MTHDARELTCAVSHLLARYAWAIDDRDYESLRDVFTSGVAADYGAFVCSDVDELVVRMEEIHRGLRTTQHMVGSVLAEPTEDGRARVRSHVRATLVRGGEHKGRVEVAAAYRDLVVPTSDGLRIAERRVEGRWISGDRSILPWFHARTPGTTSSSPDDRGN